MNRRKFITALGTVAVGSGAALGTGAFTTASAERSFTVSTADDRNGLLELRAGDGAATSDVVGTKSASDNNQITFSFKKINDNALFTFDSILTVVNNTSNENLNVSTLRFVPEDASGNEVSDSGLDGSSYTSPIGVYKASGSQDKDPLDNAYDRAVDNVLTGFSTGGSDTNSALTPGDQVNVGFVIDSTGDALSEITRVNIVARTAESGDP